MDEETQNIYNTHFQLSAIKRDLAILAIGFAILYAGLGSSEDVQIALNPTKSLQLVVRGLFLFSRLVSCALLPTVSIDKVGNKASLVIAYGIHLVFLLASLDPRFSTLIPCSLASGITSSLLWTSTCVYVTSLSIGYSKFSTDDVASDATMSKFFAFFFSVVYVFFSIPAILTSVVLNPNSPEHISESQLSFCGAKYCNEKLEAEKECFDERTTTTATMNSIVPANVTWCSIPLYTQPPEEKAFTLGGLYFGFGFIGFVTVLCLMRNLVTGQVVTTSDPDDLPIGLSRQLCNHLGATFDILRHNPAMFLLDFAAFCYGAIEYFVIYDFSQAFTLCVAGYHLRGYILFAFALLAFITSTVFIFIYPSYCRLWMLGISTLLSFASLLPLFVWTPTPLTKGVAIVLAIFWGIVNSIWNINLTTLYGTMGSRQLSSAFANLFFWWTLGQFLSFAWSELLCIQHKLYVLCPMLAASTVALAALEAWIRSPVLFSGKRVAPEGSSIKSPVKSNKQTNAISVIDTSDSSGENKRGVNFHERQHADPISIDDESRRKESLASLQKSVSVISDEGKHEEEINSRGSGSISSDPSHAPSAPPSDEMISPRKESPHKEVDIIQ